MNPTTKAELVAQLMAERFPPLDQLVAESRFVVPHPLMSAAERLQAQREAARAARIRWSKSDTPKAIRERQRFLRDLPAWRDDETELPPNLRGVA